MTETHAVTSPLGIWMTKFRCSDGELARRIGDVTPAHIGTIRRGRSRPSDSLKIAIAEHTLTIERELGVAEPRGVEVLDWFAVTAKAS